MPNMLKLASHEYSEAAAERAGSCRKPERWNGVQIATTVGMKTSGNGKGLSETGAPFSFSDIVRVGAGYKPRHDFVYARADVSRLYGIGVTSRLCIPWL